MLPFYWQVHPLEQQEKGFVGCQPWLDKFPKRETERNVKRRSDHWGFVLNIYSQRLEGLSLDQRVGLLMDKCINLENEKIDGGKKPFTSKVMVFTANEGLLNSI